MKGLRGRISTLSAAGPMYVVTEISGGGGGVGTTTGLVPVNSGIVPLSATTETIRVSGDLTSGTRSSRASSVAPGGRASVVSASVSDGGRTTTNRTPSMVRPKLPRTALDGSTGATATRAMALGSNPSRQVTTITRRPSAR